METDKPVYVRRMETAKPADARSMETAKPADGRSIETVKPADARSIEMAKPADGVRMETEKLVESLERVDTIDAYLDAYGAHCNEGFSFSEYFDVLFREKKLKKMEILERSGLERSYAHEIIRGSKRPSRDKVVLMAFGMRLTIQEAQQLLRHSGFNPLTPKVRRDAVVLFALTHGLTVIATNELLEENGLDLLL